MKGARESVLQWAEHFSVGEDKERQALICVVQASPQDMIAATAGLEAMCELPRLPGDENHIANMTTNTT